MYSEESPILVLEYVLYLASNCVKNSHVFWGAKGVEEPELTWEGLWSPLRLALVLSKPVQEGGSRTRE